MLSREPHQLGTEPDERASVLDHRLPSVGALHETERVGLFVPVVEPADGRHLIDQRLASGPEPIAKKILVPFRQIEYRRQETAVAHPGETGLHDLKAARGRGLIPFRPVRNNFCGVVVKVRAGHPERPEQIRLVVPAETEPAGPLDDDGQQEVARVGVGVTAARFEIERPLAADQIKRHGFRDFVGERTPGQAPEAQIVANAARVVHEVPDRDPVGIRRQLGNPFPNRIVERNLPLLRQQRRAHGGELLRCRRDIEDGGRGDRRPLVQIRHAIAAAVDDLAVAEHPHGTARSVGMVILGENPIDRLGFRISRARPQGENQQEGKEARSPGSNHRIRSLKGACIQYRMQKVSSRRPFLPPDPCRPDGAAGQPRVGPNGGAGWPSITRSPSTSAPAN